MGDRFFLRRGSGRRRGTWIWILICFLRRGCWGRFRGSRFGLLLLSWGCLLLRRGGRRVGFAGSECELYECSYILGPRPKLAHMNCPVLVLLDALLKSPSGCRYIDWTCAGFGILRDVNTGTISQTDATAEIHPCFRRAAQSKLCFTQKHIPGDPLYKR